MQAIIYRSYGSPDVLRLEELDKSAPGGDQVLVRVAASSVNPMDYHLMSGAYLMRPFSGLRRPKQTRPGADLAGEVEAVGKNVSRFKPGDLVFGAARGAFAEYVLAAEDRLAVVPGNLSLEQAAALPVAGLTALQGLRDKGELEPGQKVLITGASGGVGSFAVQIAKSLGGEVSAICSTGSLDFVRGLGADRVIDYTREDFSRGPERYDLVFDCVGHRPLSAYRRVMKARGTFVAVGARPGGRWIGPLPYLLRLLVSSWFVSQRVVFFMAKLNSEELEKLGRLVRAGKVTPAIDRSYPLSEAGAALKHLMEGHPKGKVVIAVAGRRGSRGVVPGIREDPLDRYRRLPIDR